MRTPRFKAAPDEEAGCYHCISRVVEERHAFEEREREKFRALLQEYAAFCGVEVLTWCILSNHFHLFIRVPKKPATPPPIEALIERLNHLSSSALSAAAAQQMVERFRAAGQEGPVEELRQRLWVQMYDLIPTTLNDRYNACRGSVCLNQEPVRNEGTDAAWVRPPSLQPGHDTLPLFGEAGEHPVTKTVLELVP